MNSGMSSARLYLTAIVNLDTLTGISSHCSLNHGLDIPFPLPPHVTKLGICNHVVGPCGLLRLSEHI
jgi:hypothetical protein